MDPTQDAAQRLIESERITVKAVIVPSGEDPVPYLRDAGIVEPVALPFAYAEDGVSLASMGDGWTPGVPATLVPAESGGPGDALAGGAIGAAQDHPETDTAAESPGTLSAMQTVMLPEAYGMRPMAPVRRPAER